MNNQSHSHRRCRILISTLVGATILSGCENMPDAFKPKAEAPTAEKPQLASGVLVLEERDVEAPEVFNVTDEGIWDGRPSFGGVWVAYPGNTQPERVNIRNVKTNTSVVGALFKREAANPGPKITLSSDAASALGVVPGQPTRLTITALRREPFEVKPESAPIPATEVVSETVLPPVNAKTREAAETKETPEATTVIKKIEPPETQAPIVSAKPAATTTVEPSSSTTSTPTTPSGPFTKRFLQVGTFSSQANAKQLRQKLEKAGVPTSVFANTQNSGRTLYRVLSGPAKSPEEMKTYMTKVSDLGFKDAFRVER